jgi:tungstate transport system permease protein
MSETTFVPIVALSLIVSFSATAVAAVLGLPAGAALAISRFPGRRLLILLANAFLGLPPVMVELALYLTLSRSGPLGALGLLFTPGAMVLAQAVLALPIITALVHRAIEGPWEEYGGVLRVEGATRLRTIKMLLAIARRSVLTAVLAGFGRTVSEFGAVLIVGGNIAGYTRTMTTAIVLETSKGNLGLALGLGLILIGIRIAVSAGAFVLGEKESMVAPPASPTGLDAATVHCRPSCSTSSPTWSRRGGYATKRASDTPRRLMQTSSSAATRTRRRMPSRPPRIKSPTSPPRSWPSRPERWPKTSSRCCARPRYSMTSSPRWVELWPGGAPLRCSPSVRAALEWTREHYDADRRPGMPFAREHFTALWQEYFARLLNDPNAQFEWRPPRPEDHRAVNPFAVARPGQFNFKPRSLEADERLEAQRVAAEAKAQDAGPPPFVPEAAWTAAQKFRREKEEATVAAAERELALGSTEGR